MDTSIEERSSRFVVSAHKAVTYIVLLAVFAMTICINIARAEVAEIVNNIPMTPMTMTAIELAPRTTLLEEGIEAPPLPGVATGEIKSFTVPSAETGFKAYMGYKAITNRSSTQWKLQQDAVTDENGFRRLGSYYMVAMGTFYAPQCGRVFEVTLENGTVFQCVVGDVKSDMHTDSLHQHRNGNVIEFIVDTNKISEICKRMGDMSYAEGLGFDSKISSIVLLYSPY